MFFFFLKGFYYACTAGLALKWLLLQRETEKKRCDRPENLTKEYEIQNSCSKARYPLGNISFKYDFHI